MTIERYDTRHHSGPTPEARLRNRWRNSGEGANPNHSVQSTSSGLNFTNIHSAGHEVDPATRARESGDPQHQRHHDEATQQTTAYFRGHGRHEEEND